MMRACRKRRIVPGGLCDAGKVALGIQDDGVVLGKS